MLMLMKTYSIYLCSYEVHQLNKCFWPYEIACKTNVPFSKETNKIDFHCNSVYCFLSEWNISVN